MTVDAAHGSDALEQALATAYRGAEEPPGLRAFLRAPIRAGRMCCVFYSGRSGSYFAQSFFDTYGHPQVLTVPRDALSYIDESLNPDALSYFNFQMERTADLVEQYCAIVLDAFPRLFTDTLRNDVKPVDRALVAPILAAQLLPLERGALTHETLLKALFVAYRVAAGGRLACAGPLTYLWQAHTPSYGRKRWAKETFADSRLLTIVRFPEKSLDSHLVHQAFHQFIPPASTLLRRLLFEHMAVDNDLLNDPSDGSEGAVRFEDLHHHPAHVLRAICAWLGVAYEDGLARIENDVPFNSVGRLVSGARTLTPDEFACKLFNYYDRLKIRFLLQEEYRAWGYGATCEGGLEASLAAFGSDLVAQTVPFAAQAVLTQLQHSDDGWFSGAPEKAAASIDGLTSLHAENLQLYNHYREHRKRRAAGAPITPLLYALASLPVA